ncbi:sensor histidine kinase [Nocardia jinanensis]|uniref:histidine kinase n=1 Tax=Nocardia jinanensis TaxID=382504 RepID=A0A917RB24_9NOCA|nr:HAMP domain-containing sensor histidine kinase [Nocardia jinanensis]GGK98481.1 two-component sensor histidine kinase [Nocardia jinanensis]
MRNRLVAILVIMAALTVAGLAFPLGASSATGRTQELWFSRYVDAEWFGDLAAEAITSGNTESLVLAMRRYHDLYGDAVMVVDSAGREMANLGVPSDDPAVIAMLTEARRNRHARQPPHRLRPGDPETMLIAVPVGRGVRIEGAVLIEASTGEAIEDIEDGLAVITILSWTALAVFAIAAVLLSRWILGPMMRLSSSVRYLTASLPRPAATVTAGAMQRHYSGPPEVRMLAQSFDSMASAVTESVDAQRQLVADTAHAIRNPLAALAIRLESLERFIPEEGAAAYRRTSYQVDRLSSVLDGLLRLAVAETPTGFAAAHPDGDWPSECSVRHVVTDRVDEWQPAFDAAEMTLGVHFSSVPDDLMVAIPGQVLDQILDVALSNSSRYAGAGAATRVTIETVEKHVRISVADNGVGVSPAELDQLVNRFFRGASASAGGTGLGLSIAVALATQHGGDLSVESEEPRGLRVVVRVPAWTTQDKR